MQQAVETLERPHTTDVAKAIETIGAIEKTDHKYNNTYTDCWGHTHQAQIGSVITPKVGVYAAITVKDKILLKYPEPNSTIAELVGDTLEDRENAMTAIRRVVSDTLGQDIDMFQIGNKHVDTIPYYAHARKEYWEYSMMFVRIDLSHAEHLVFEGTHLCEDGSRLAWHSIADLYEVALNYVHSTAFRTLLGA